MQYAAAMMRRATITGSVVVAFALLGAALLATAWSTRSSVIDATAVVRSGQALAVEQAVRADLADLGGPPASDELVAIVHDHDRDGLRYLATLDAHGHVLAGAGAPVGRRDGDPARGELGKGGRHVALVGDRVRLEVRASFRRAWGSGTRPFWIVMEIEPVEAEAMREAATRTVGIGALAALAMIGVAVALVRRELRRRDADRVRERERRLASLGEMSAVLAHEIKNPLASLKGNAQLLAAMQDGDKPRAKAERVVDEARRLERLVDDLLQFVRTGELARGEVDVGALLAAHASDGVVVAPPAAPIAWSLDGERVREVIANLIDNARAAGGPVEVAARVDRGRLVIDVRDHGPGVPAADRERIFEPFFTNKPHGTGLGLAVARRIVELHGGSLAVLDAAGGGAVFRVEIPR